MSIREYHFSRRSEMEHPTDPAAVRELPIGRVDTLGGVTHFYFTNRFHSADEVLAFAQGHPHLGIYNEMGEVCDPQQVAAEIGGMKISTASLGRRGMGAHPPFSDLSEWEN